MSRNVIDGAARWASAIPARKFEIRQVRNQNERGKMQGESRVVVLNAVELGRFEMDDFAQLVR